MKKLLSTFSTDRKIDNVTKQPIEPTVFYGTGSQNKMFENANKFNHKFFIAEQILFGDKPSYQYMSFKNIDDFIKFDKQFKSKSFYELIRDNTPVNEYYDIDAKVQDWKSADELIVEFLNLRRNFLKSNFCPIVDNSMYFVNTKIRYDELYITEACNDKKL